MIKRDEIILVVFGIIFIFSVIMLVLESLSIDLEDIRFATGGNTSANVSISKFFSIELSPNLRDGILFGTISDLPTSNQNATHNHDMLIPLNSSTMWINISDTSSTNVDLCIKANANLTEKGGSGDTISLQNETYSTSSFTDMLNPSLSSEVNLSLGYELTSTGISPGSLEFYRFWLDIPLATVPGSYNNTISFKAVQSTTVC